MNITPRIFGQPSDRQAVLAIARQSATPETIFDIPRYSDLAACLAPVTSANATSRDEQRRQIIQRSTSLWETDAGAAVAYALIPGTTSLSFGILPQWRTIALERAILAWGFGHLRNEGRFPFLMVRCHESDQARQSALTQEGFHPQPYQDVYLTRTLDDALPTPALPAGFQVRAGVTVAEHAAYQGLHQAVFGNEMNMDEHLLSTYQPELDLIAIAPDGTWAAFCYCTLEQIADAQHIERVGSVGVLGVHPAFRRRGLGRALLLTAMQRARQQGGTRIVLETENDPTPAMTLYRSLGFQPGSPWRWWRKRV
jgi:mycothiol synthase